MKYVIVGRCGVNDGGGPANVIKALLKEYSRQNIDIVAILMNNEITSIKFITRLLSNVLFKRNICVNVHTSGFLIPLLVLLISKINRLNRYYLTIHGIYAVETQQKDNGKLIYKILEKIIYKKFPNIICVSEMLKNDIKLEFGRTKNVYVIPNATDAKSKKSKVQRDYIQLIEVGGLKKGKGIDKILDLVSFLNNEKNMDVRLLIYGSEEGNRNIDWLNNKLLNLKIENKVVFRGVVNDKQIIYDSVSQSDVQLCLSYYDTFNVAIAESLVLGCPCISSDKCGASYLINDDNGLVVNLQNNNLYDQIYEYIHSIIYDKERKKKIYDNREIYIDQLSWEKVCESYIKLMGR